MSRIKFICCFSLLVTMSCSLYAQTKDTIPAQKIIEKGSKGDIIVGEKNKKDQLNETPVLLNAKDTVRRKDARSSKKLCRKQNKKGS